MHGDGNDLKYAQASDVISKGERYWFDQQETAEQIAHNRKYQLLSPAEQYFRLCFEVCQDPSEGECSRLPTSSSPTSTALFTNAPIWAPYIL